MTAVVVGVALACLVQRTLHGVILSGYLGEPGTGMALPVEWRLGQDRAAPAADTVRGWERSPDPDSDYLGALYK
ncbi:MAG: hypothetical protein CL878_09855 [Dehalococcoidia bacterium]|nr:hypothetical protein [Dehalococcoidia bacterium]